MTQEEKQLLLRDLCARLPYNVIVSKSVYGHDPELYYLDLYKLAELRDGDPVIIKPYLRPMSSMTEEERSELRIIWHEDFVGDSSLSPENLGIAAIYPCYPKTTDFYLSHHFDYKGLIEKGLALETPEGMYKD